MNLLLVTAEEVDAGGHVLLTDRRADHLRRVLKVEVGQQVRLGVLDGDRGLGRVVAVDAAGIELALGDGFGGEPSVVASECELEHTHEMEPEVEVILALPRPQALHRLLQSVATMGVRRLDLVRSWRVEKSFFGSPSVTPEAIRKHLWLGAEQGMLNRLPEVHVEPRLGPFFDALEERGTADTLSLLAHPEAPRRIEDVVPSYGGCRRVRIAIGPEGGWIDREVERFVALGFHAVQLGPWILKVENALTAMLAQLHLLRRWHDAAAGTGAAVAGSGGAAEGRPSQDPMLGDDLSAGS